MPLSDENKFANLVSALNEVMARQERLEKRLALIEERLFPEAQAAAPEPVRVQAEPAPLPIAEELPVAPPVPPVSKSSPPESPRLESKLGLTLLNRVGVVTLVLGVAFFFKWAVDNDWIGPLGRVVVGVIAGLAMLAIADVLWRKQQQVFAQGITGAGAAIVYLAIYAAFEFYQLISQPVAFLLLLISTVLTAALALRYNSMVIAALGAFGAYIIPLLLSNGQDHPWFLISYLLLLNVAATALAARRGWPFLDVLSFAATVLIFGGWLIHFGGHPAGRVVATVGILAFCAQRALTSVAVLFLLAQLLTSLGVCFIWNSTPKFFWFSLLVAMGGLVFSHLRNYGPMLVSAFAAFWVSAALACLGNYTPAHVMPLATAGFVLFAAWNWYRSELDAYGLVVLGLNGPVFYAFAYSCLQPEHHSWLGLLAVAVGAAYFALGMLIYREKQAAFALAMGVGAAFLTLAIPIQLAGFTIAIAWSIQAAALTWIGLRLQSRRALIGGCVVFLLAILRVGIVDAWMYGSHDLYSLLINARFFTFAALGIALLMAAYWSAMVEAKLAFIQFIAGNVVLLAGLSLEVIGWAERSARPENEFS